MMQSAHFCVFFFSCQAPKVTISRGFILISNSWENPRWRRRWRPLLVTSQASRSTTSHEKIKAFPLKAKSFRNTGCNISKILRTGSINPNHPCTSLGVWICVYVRGLISMTFPWFENWYYLAVSFVVVTSRFIIKVLYWIFSQLHIKSLYLGFSCIENFKKFFFPTNRDLYCEFHYRRLK